MNYASLIIAIVSLVVAVWTAWKTLTLHRHELLLARRLELHSLLQEADKILIEKPFLIRSLRSSKTYLSIEEWSPQEKDSLDIFITIYLNVFEAAQSVLSQTSRISSSENEIRTAWDNTIRNFFEDCPAAKSFWETFRGTYYEGFQTFIDRIISDRRS